MGRGFAPDPPPIRTTAHPHHMSDSTATAEFPRRRVFAGLFVATIASMLGLGAVVPILPLYAKHMGASGTMVGLILAGFALSRGTFAPLMGHLSDRYGRRRVLVIGLILEVVFSAAYVLAGTPIVLLGVRLMQGFSSVMVTPIAQAYAGDITPEGREGEYMNLFFISLFGGMAIGPFLGGWLSDVYSLEAPFWGMAAAAATALALVLLLIPDQDPPGADDTDAADKPGVVESFRRVLDDRPMRGVLSYIASRGFYRWGFNAFFPIFAVRQLDLSRTQVGMLLSGYMLAGGIMQWPMGKLSDVWSDQRDLFVLWGGTITAALMFVLPASHNAVVVGSLVVVLGVLSAIARAAVIAIRTDRGRIHGMGAVTGAFTTSMSLGQVLGPILFGVLVDYFDIEMSFYLGGVIGLLGAWSAYGFLREGPEVGMADA